MENTLYVSVIVLTVISLIQLIILLIFMSWNRGTKLNNPESQSNIPFTEQELKGLLSKSDEELQELATEITNGDVDVLRLLFQEWLDIYNKEKHIYTASELQVILTYNQNLLEFIDTIIELTIVEHSDLQRMIDEEYNPVKLDDEIKIISTEVFSAINRNILDSVMIVNREYIYGYIIKQTRHILISVILDNQK